MRDVRVVVEIAGAGRLPVAVATVETAVRRTAGRAGTRRAAGRVAASRHARGAARASASAASARPFHDAIALSSSPGCGRVSRISSSRARTSGSSSPRTIDRPCSNGSSSSAGYALLGSPCVGEALDSVGVGVLRGGEAALGQQQLAQHVVERLLDDLAVALAAGHEPAVEVRGNEQRVVVEHLLEVRDEPVRVDRVAMEPAADEVVHAPGGHPVERRRSTISSLAVTEQELEHDARRELRRVARSRPTAGRTAPKPRIASPSSDSGRAARTTALGARRRDGLDELSRVARDVGAPSRYASRNGLEHLPEARQPVTRLGREVRAAEERLALGREEDGHRPAAVPGQASTTASM